MSLTLEYHFTDPRSPLEEEIAGMSPWFHNLHLPNGVQTAPGHRLGDFPFNKWERISTAIPENLAGWRVLDIGCNAGFYSFALAGRGAQVTAIDNDPHYLRQARWAARRLGMEDRVTFQEKSVYELGRTDGQFDLVWFMGVLYHLRYPLLALDILSRLAVNLMVLQTLTMPGMAEMNTPSDIALDDRDSMLLPGWPILAFIEKHFEGDPTNWWAPNHAAVKAMLRSSGFSVAGVIDDETYLCISDTGDDSELREHITREMNSALGLSENR